MSVTHEISTGAAASAAGVAMKTAPPAVVTGLSMAGMPLSDWVYVATLVWIAIQAGFFLRDRLVARNKRKTRRTKVAGDE